MVFQERKIRLVSALFGLFGSVGVHGKIATATHTGPIVNLYVVPAQTGMTFVWLSKQENATGFPPAGMTIHNSFYFK